MEPGSWTEVAGVIVTGALTLYAVIQTRRSDQRAQESAKQAAQATRDAHARDLEMLDLERRRQASQVTWRCIPWWKPSADPRDDPELQVIPFKEDKPEFTGDPPTGYKRPSVFSEHAPRSFVMVQLSNTGTSHVSGSSIRFRHGARDDDRETREIALIPVGVSYVVFEIASSQSQTSSSEPERRAILTNTYVDYIEFQDDYGRVWRRLGTGRLEQRQSEPGAVEVGTAPVDPEDRV